MNSHRVFIQTLPYLPYIESLRESYVRTQYTSILMTNRFVVKLRPVMILTHSAPPSLLAEVMSL